MSPRRNSGAARRAQKAAAKANNEQATPTRELSTQQATTVCEEEDTPAFGEVNEESQPEKTQEEPQERQAQDLAANEQEQKKENEANEGDQAAGEHVEGEEKTEGSTDEKEGCPKESTAKVEGEGQAKERKAEVEEAEETPTEGTAEVKEEEEEAVQDVHADESEDNGHQETAAGEENEPAESEEKESREEIQDGQQQEEQAQQPIGEDQTEEQHEEAQQQPADATELEEKKEHPEDDQQEMEGAVAEERQEGLPTQCSGSFVDWTGSEFEFSVAPPGGSRDATASICEELFVSGDGPYGPQGRRRVFNEAQGVIMKRIPAAMARYLEEAHDESVGDACLSCSSDVSNNCFPAAKLFVETIFAGGAAIMSQLYQYRKEILQGVACLTTSTFKCLRTCVCTVTPPPQEARKNERTPPPSPWTTIGDSTEMWAPLGSAQLSWAQSQEFRQSVYANGEASSLSPQPSLEPLQQRSETLQSHYRPVVAPGTNQTIFSRRVTANH